MKNFITFLFLLLCCPGIRLAAQTNYYTETKTFHEDGYTYQCDVNEAAMVSLYNAEALVYQYVVKWHINCISIFKRRHI